MIKLITFDLWNTIVSGKNSKKHFQYRVERIKDIAAGNNTDISDESIEKGLDAAWAYFMEEWDKRVYTPTAKAMMNVFFKSAEIEPSPELSECLISFMEDSLLDIDNSPVDGVNALIEELNDKYILAIVSDTGYTPGRNLRILLKHIGLFRYFSFFAFSDEIGVSKPDRRIFEYVLNYAGIMPDESLHIGDLLRTDIEGANNSGMKSVHFHRENFHKEEEHPAIPSYKTDNASDIYNFVSSLH